MRKKLAVVLAAGLIGGLLGSVAVAQRADSPKVTGGGQIDVAADGQGAGNTLAFVGIQDQQSGQVEYVPTSSGGGSSENHWHGTVTCVNIEGNRARLSGPKFGRNQSGNFWLEIIDSGVPANGTDAIRLAENSNKNCNQEDDSARETELGRGNATVHNGS